MPTTATRTPAVGFLQPGAPDVLVDLEIDVPAPEGHDLLVDVRAVSVNPADVKVRAAAGPGGTPKVFGYDAAGVVLAVGDAVTAYAPGDEVYYAGSISRPGSNAGVQLVDERIVGRKPARLGFAQAAALPLTAITAWETLFDRFRLSSIATARCSSSARPAASDRWSCSWPVRSPASPSSARRHGPSPGDGSATSARTTS